MNTKPSWIRIEQDQQRHRHPRGAGPGDDPRDSEAGSRRTQDDERYAQKIEALGRPGDRTRTAIPAAPIAT